MTDIWSCEEGKCGGFEQDFLNMEDAITADIVLPVTYPRFGHNGGALLLQ